MTCGLPSPQNSYVVRSPLADSCYPAVSESIWREAAARECFAAYQQLCGHAESHLRAVLMENCITSEDIVMDLIADLLDGRVHHPPAGVEPIAWFMGVIRRRARRVARL